MYNDGIAFVLSPLVVLQVRRYRLAPRGIRPMTQYPDITIPQAATFAADIASDDRLHPTDLRVYLALCVLGAWHTVIRVTLAEIANFLHRSCVTVGAAVRRLARLGYIVRRRLHGGVLAVSVRHTAIVDTGGAS